MGKEKKSICIVLCSKGYPEKYNKDIEIERLDKIHLDKDSFIFHAGTYEQQGKIFSNGGRVLNVISVSESLLNARNKSITYLNKINWKNGYFRKDIGWREIDNK